MRTKWETFLSKEIAIEYKTAIYCFCAYFFYAAYRLVQGKLTADIIDLIEICITAYIITNIQVHIFKNFDEVDQLTKSVWLRVWICSGLYAICAQWLHWFDGNIKAALGFMIYVALTYLTVFTANKIKRKIDSKQLNQQLEHFKKQKEIRHD